MKAIKSLAICICMFLSLGAPCLIYAQNATETAEQFQKSYVKDAIPTAPEQNRRPSNYKPFNYKYSLENLSKKYSEDMMGRASKQYAIVQQVNQEGKWKPTPSSIDSHEAPEWLRDAKFGMFIDWGLWSVGGWAPKRKEGPMYPDWYENQIYTDSATIIYHEKNWGKDVQRDDLIPLFGAKTYNPEKLADLAVEAGMKYIIPFSKHHSGFCLWPSSYTHRDAGDMGPKKDLIKPLVEQCRINGLKFGFYFSVEEWEYPIINEQGVLSNRAWAGKMLPYDPILEKKSSGKIAVKNFAKDYIVPQATEFIDKYDPDILWYDGEWDASAEALKTYEISSYFYNRAEGRKEVAVNDRYGLDESGQRLRFKRGDIFTSEFHDNDDKVQAHAWEANRGISQSFGYNWQDTDENVISTKDFVKMFVDIVANGGNLLLIVNLDGQGALPAVQEKRLKDIGKWLQVNGEGIYGTRSFSVKSEGTVRYTKSKDSKSVFAIATEWPGKELKLKSVKPKEGSQVYMLGVNNPLSWRYDKLDGTISIDIPDDLQIESNRPCDHAYVFKIEP
ncbi:MAG: alpha-L-fucosidase [bacterium]